MMRYGRRTFNALAVAVLAVLLSHPIGWAQDQVKNFFDQCAGGAATPCDNTLNIKGTWKIGTTAIVPTAAQINLLTQGVAAGYKVARGTVTLDGTNPSSATTGLATLVSCTVQNKRSVAPGLDPHSFTTITDAVAGRLDVYAWKPTGAGDTTLIASTDADDTIDWVCVGT